MTNMRLSLTYSKHQYMVRVIKCFYSLSYHRLKQVALVRQFSDSNDGRCGDQLEMGYNSHLGRISNEELQLRITKLNELELNDSSGSSRMRLIKHHPKTVKHRYLSLLEYGFHQSQISSLIISRYLSLVKMKVSTLKNKKLLAPECDVADNLLSYTPLARSSFQPEQMTDSSSPEQIKMLILRRILIELVGFEEDFDPKRVLFSRLRHKSVYEILRNISTLRHQVGIPLEKIRNNPFLLSAVSADSTLEIMSKLKTIAGVDIKDILNDHPKILASPVEGLLKIHQYLQEAEVSDEAVAKCFDVFTLNCETVRQRLQELKRNRFFCLCKHHPQLLKLIMYQKKAKTRLEMLKQDKVDFCSLSTLASSDKHFNKFFEIGMQRHRGMDLVYYLSVELGCTKQTVKARLKRHPYWFYSSLVTVSQNVKFLLARGFNKHQILNEVCLVLYPCKEVAEELDRVAERDESAVCQDETGTLSKSKILPLVLYFLERSVHFTGEAMIINKETPPPSPGTTPPPSPGATPPPSPGTTPPPSPGTTPPPSRTLSFSTTFSEESVHKVCS